MPLVATYTDANFSGLEALNNYASYCWDETLELYYAQARMYDQATGRFTSEDPIRDGSNWYVYCAGDPVNAVDVTGLAFSTAKYDTNSDNVREIQKFLYGIGYFIGTEVSSTADLNGQFGESTLNAIVRFQMQYMGLSWTSLFANKEATTSNYIGVDESTVEALERYKKLLEDQTVPSAMKKYMGSATLLVVANGNVRMKIEAKNTDKAYAKVTIGANDLIKNGLGDAQKETNAKFIYNYLKGKGWTKGAICGLLGNVEQESKMNPGAWQSASKITTSTKGDGSGFGLFQWDPCGNKYFAYMKCYYVGFDSKEASIKTIEALVSSNPEELINTQLNYFIYSAQPGRGEWLKGEATVDPIYAVQQPTVGKKYMTFSEYTRENTISAGDLALIFCAHYERTTNHLPDRVKNAEEWYNFNF